MEQIFAFSSLLVMPFWALLIFAPRWSWTRRIAASPLIVLPAALLYAALVLPSAFSLLPSLANPNLSDIAALLGTPQGATIGWVHFLAFDLFVARWIYLDSQEHRFHPLLMAPVLLLVLMFGPLGLVVYLGIKAAVRLKAT